MTRRLVASLSFAVLLASPLANAQAIIGSATGFVFPSVASTPGAFGAYFHTRVVLYNPHSFGMNVLTGMVTPNGATPAVTLTLNPNTYYYWEDFPQDVFRYTGGGGLGIASFEGNLFWATAEVYTEGAGGRFSTQVPGMLSRDRVTSLSSASSLAVRRDSSNRLNYGCANFNGRTTTVNVRTRFGSNNYTDTLTMPANGWTQKAATAGDGTGAIGFALASSDQLNDLGVYCYAVTVNNTSNDGVLTPAVYF